MAPSEPIESLIQSYLDGRSSLAESSELARLLCDEPAAADAFARATRFDALLEAQFGEQGAMTRLMAEATAPAPGPVRANRRRIFTAIAAAALAIVGGARWWGRDATKGATPPRVVSGRVLVDGVEASTISDGAHVDVLGNAAAAIRLGDGSDVRLAPASAVVFHAGAGVPSVELSYGNATFRNRDAHRSIRVDTPVGAVSARDAEFAVELQSTTDEGAKSLRPNPLALLTLAVLAGRVEVKDAGERVQVGAGERRAFAPEKKPRFAGRVTSVSSDGKRVVLEGKPIKSGAPPQQREVRITEQTQLSYYGTPKDGDRPTVGYPAIAWLDKAAPENAVALEFGDKTPHVEGMVKRTADGGSTVTVEVYRKNDVPIERTVTLNERTRVSYSGVDAAGTKPTVGFRALIWLEGDRATEVRFLFKAKGAPPSPEAPKPPPTIKPRATKAATESKPDRLPPDEPPRIDKSKPATKERASANAKPKPLPRRASTRDPLPVATEIDGVIEGRLAETEIIASPAADDAEFLRRASIDIAGRIPTYAAALAFLESTDPKKRQKLIDDLLSDPAYGRRFGAAWKRLISPRPASNGKPQVDRITPWLAEQFNRNRGWNEVVYELLTTEANVAREPQGYFLAVNSEHFDPRPNLLAASTARLFLGAQLACAECHDHPFAGWKQTEFWNLAAFFSRVHKRSKSDFSWTEEPTDPPGVATITIPEGGEAAGTVVPARFLGGGEPKFEPSAPLRPLLAAWVTAADNPYFARAMVNRLWAHFFGRGLVEPLDGFRAGVSASHPAVLDRLAEEFTASGYDVQHVIRALCNTRAYGRTSRPLPENENDTVMFSHMAVKVLSPDVLYDSLTIALNGNPATTAAGKNGKVAQAAPFTIGPRDEFINSFSGPAAESKANEYAHGIPQLLRLMNAESFNVGAPLAKAVAGSDGTPEEKIAMLYLATLSRRPTEDERRALVEYVDARRGTEQAYAGALWILLNTSEFVLNR